MAHRAHRLTRTHAQALLDRKGAKYDEVVLDSDPEGQRKMAAKAGRSTVPQIWIGEKHVGGCDDLHALDADGKLDVLLKGSA